MKATDNLAKAIPPSDNFEEEFTTLQIKLICSLFKSAVKKELNDFSDAPLAMHYIYKCNTFKKHQFFEIVEIHGYYSREGVVNKLEAYRKELFGDWTILAIPSKQNSSYASILYFCREWQNNPTHAI